VIASACANALVLLLVVRGVRSLGIGVLSVDRATLKRLAIHGIPFFFFGLTMTLQPNIDALLLSKFAPEEAVGWHAAARKLVGVLAYPASALVTALYPTLCRLHGDDRAEFCRTTRAALVTAALIGVPLAVGCGVYADLGILIFSKSAFGPAADNLRILSLFVLLLYLSMPLGSALLAEGRQRQWTAIQSLCLVVSVVLDPWLIPVFQRHNANGGIGVGVSTVASELLMLAFAVYLLPRAIFDRAFFQQLSRIAIAGCVMAAAGYTRRWLTPWPSVPIACLVYVGCLRALGGLTNEQLRSLHQVLPRKLAARLTRQTTTQA
jgi:O-antigen/teichoic acid export membrane protein